jgi:hydrogenase maturation protein HypF
LRLEGLVQGVGFRPTVRRLADRLTLTGWVANSDQGVVIEIEGPGPVLENFLDLLTGELPPLARIDGMQREELAPVEEAGFSIRPTLKKGAPTALILPDAATCPDCRREIRDRENRRYLYPFTNCTNCGPRFSIVEAIPYDRPNTTMRRFSMCASCWTEYKDPLNRRFHAQPNACPDCGPQLALLDPYGVKLAGRHDALLAAADAVRQGRILALKGLGGYQLLADARNGDAVDRLRLRKRRPDKPLAVMVPSLTEAMESCRISALERRLLTSTEAPIVLLRRCDVAERGRALLAESVAPGNPMLGLMLPYTPLHHLLMAELGFPVIATSGNLADEPMATGEKEAFQQLGGIADLFLVHDRPIACPIDDSVVRVMAGRPLVLRRARGYAPLPVSMARKIPSILALGGHLKAAPAVTVGAKVLVGPHVGDLDTAEARRVFTASVDRLAGLHKVHPGAVARDKHPDYYGTKLASRWGLKEIQVQHHLAHIVACMAENGIADERVLGVAWDGTGYGEDGTIWGGEFMIVDGPRVRRIARFLPFPLPGGEKATREPRRAAIGLLHALFGERALANDVLTPVRSFTPAERKTLARMLSRNLNTPVTSSAGRLFDGVAALADLAQKTSFEGQAAMDLEFAAEGRSRPMRYEPMALISGGEEGAPLDLDWRPVVRSVLADIRRGAPASDIAAAFHGALIEAIVAVARHAGEARIVLTGGCFQNRVLTEGAIDRLRKSAFEPFWHGTVPPNDGGLALGQAVWAARLLAAGEG